MPELPEVETVARQLSAAVAGRCVHGVEIRDAKLAHIAPARLTGRRISAVTRIGKLVVLVLDGAPASPCLAVHLRMTGRLIWQPDGADAAIGAQAAEAAFVQRVPASERHARAILRLEGGALLFSDVRRFGTLELYDGLAAVPQAGVEPLSRAFTPRWLAAQLAGARGEIKPWLLRQDRIAGLGNIYASEILHACAIHPQRQCASLGADECACLARETRRILRLSIRHCGTTFSDFQDTTGSTGSFQRFLKVYGRAGEGCERCGEPLLRIVQQQRSTFFCAACQQ